jgi:hypothetical protein
VKASKLNRKGWITADVLFSGQWHKGGHESLSDPDIDEKVLADMKHRCGVQNSKQQWCKTVGS